MSEVIAFMYFLCVSTSAVLSDIFPQSDCPFQDQLRQDNGLLYTPLNGLKVKLSLQNGHPFTSEKYTMETKCFGICLGSIISCLKIWKALRIPLQEEEMDLAMLKKAIYLNLEECNEARAKVKEDNLEKFRSKHFMSRNLNNSQISAVIQVVNALESKFSSNIKLVQGPPGIGKTSMLISLLSIFSHKMFRDKYMQKVHFREHNVQLSDFLKIDCFESAKIAGDTFSYPLMIKSRCLAYDGRGNAVANCEEDVRTAVSALGGFERGLYAEKWAPFIKELAVIVARGRHGIVCCFPVVETIHKDSICHMVEAPADLSTEIREMAVQVAKRAVSSLKGARVFVVELFLTGDGQILLNEIAPRPHNSGHDTIEACYVSQFEQHLRAILGLPLGDASMKVPSAIMYNLLGEDEGEKGFIKADQLMKKAVSVAGASVHWYEKPEMRKQRKMGHITVVGPSMDLVRAHMKLIVDGETQDKSFGSVSTQPSENSSKVLAKDFATSSENDDSGRPEVSIIMGSDSDLPVMKAAAKTFQLLNIPFEITIVSAHRTPDRMIEYAKGAHGRGIKVIIAGAGGAAHLPGMVASMTTLPVLGVPVWGPSLVGVDSLLSIVQMPDGIPVATFTIQNATNAALFAVRMLAGIHAHTKGSPEVGIIMGSDSDLPVMKAAAEIFKLLNVSYEITVVSAHQTHDRMAEYAKEIHGRGMKVIIAGGGGAEHLPVMITSMTTIPVLGVPVRGSSLDVVDSLLSTVQMPEGIPVPSFAIQNATNAALFAVRMLVIIDSNLHQRLIKYQIEMGETVMTKVERLKTIGWEDYRN